MVVKTDVSEMALLIILQVYIYWSMGYKELLGLNAFSGMLNRSSQKQTILLLSLL